MKKFFISVIIALVACLTALAGCTVVRGFENDLQVVIEVNGEYQGTYTVNQFNNTIVPVPEAPHGLMFKGWTADPDWEQKGADNVKISENKGLIRYDDVKDCVVGDERSVTLYPVFGEIPRHDIAIAWYNKVATSGLDEGIIDGFQTELYAYLTSQGMDTSTMDIVIRPYAGNVGPTCDAIKNDGDIDIMIGWAAASNLEGTGGLKPGVDFLENNGNINISGNKARYAARLSDTETCKLVYAWILEKYAGEGGPKLDYIVSDEPDVPVDPDDPVDPVTPDKPAVAITETLLNVSIWNNTSGAWINNEQIEKLKTDFGTYLTGKGVDLTKVTINWIVEPDVTNVAALVASVKAAGNIDFVVACGNNVNSDGNLTNLQKAQVAESPYMTAGRYVALLHQDIPNQLAVQLFEFMTGTEFKLNITETQLNVSVWNNNYTWISAEQIAKVKVDFNEYLTQLGADVTKITINWTEEPATKVADLVASVNAAGNIDFVLACGNNVNSDGNLTNLVKKQVAESPYMSANRFVAVLNKDNPNQLAVLLYEFITSSGFTVNAA